MTGTHGSAVDWRSSCPVSCGLDVFGDKWSLLIVRDLMLAGTRTYSDFLAAPEGISTNILAARLKHLSHIGMIERCDPNAASRNNAYRLTDRGEAMQPVVLAIAHWAQLHLTDLNDSVDTSALP